MRDRYKILLLFLISILIYMPSLRSGYFVFDDLPLVNNIQDSHGSITSDFFLFKSGTYFRAMTALSYHLDAWLWDMKPAFMHFHNILIHALNACLIFLNIKLLTGSKPYLTKSTPLLTSILFIVHPINTESINWISGRSDPLATFFILTATSLFILAIKKKWQGLMWLSSLMVLLGSLAKEPAFTFFAGFTVVLLLLKSNRQEHQRAMNDFSWRFRSCLPFILGSLCYGYLRLAKHEGKVDLGTGMLVDAVVEKQSLWTDFETMVSAYGFYLKKLFIPYPLNLAISSISPQYFWVGMILMLLTLSLLARRTNSSALLLFIILPIVPALLVAAVKFALLPPFAERYLYISSAILSAGLGIAIGTRAKLSKYLTLLVLFLIILYTPLTVQRNFLWADHLKLLETINVEQQEHSSFWNIYCVVLADNEHYDKARSEYKKLLMSFPEDETAYVNFAKMELFINDPVSALNVMTPLYNGTIETEAETLFAMAEIAEAVIKKVESISLKQNAREKLLTTQLKLYESSVNPDYLLSAAETAFDNQDYEQANILSHQILEKYHTDKILTAGANRIILNTENLKD